MALSYINIKTEFFAIWLEIPQQISRHAFILSISLYCDKTGMLL